MLFIKFTRTEIEIVVLRQKVILSERVRRLLEGMVLAAKISNIPLAILRARSSI